MKAYTLAQAGNAATAWKTQIRPDPRPGHGEVLIRVRANSLNFRDLMIARGQYGTVKPNVVPLSDGAGEIVEVGPGVTRFRAGDRVCGNFFQDWIAGPMHPGTPDSAMGGSIDGMLAEHVVLRAEGVVHAPAHLSFEEAATLPCAAVTAWNALMETTNPLRPGSVVLTLGTGGVSTFALAFAKAAGCTVIATSSSDEKLERLRGMGADHLVNYKKVPDWSKRVLELTNGHGVDQVVEVGGAQTIGYSLASVKLGGVVSVIGALSGAEERIGPRAVLSRMVRVQGIFVGSVEMFERMNRAITAAKLRPTIDRTFDWDDAPAALKHMETGSHFGKVVIRGTR